MSRQQLAKRYKKSANQIDVWYRATGATRHRRCPAEQHAGNRFVPVSEFGNANIKICITCVQAGGDDRPWSKATSVIEHEISRIANAWAQRPIGQLDEDWVRWPYIP